MSHKWNFLILKKSFTLLIQLTVLNALLLIPAMIPGWSAASNFESEIKSYVSSIFLALEQSCPSIDDLKKSITAYNKFKFIEGKKFKNSGENTYIYLLNNNPNHKNNNQETITVSDETIKNRIDISRVTSLDPDINIVLSINSKAILDNILATQLKTFYSFKINKTFQPLWMVTPNSLLITLSFTLSTLLMTLWMTSTAFLSIEKQLLKKEQDFQTSDSSKNAHLIFLTLYSTRMLEDLHIVFNATNSETHQKSSLRDQNIVAICQSLGKMITFGTLQCSHGKIDLSQNLQTAINCFLRQIVSKKIHITKPKFNGILYVQQTELKNLLILCSIMRLFMNNLPPKSELFINIEQDDNQILTLIFYDNMPLPWKDFNGEGSAVNSVNNFFLTYEKLMYACADEEIKVEYMHENSGNYFTLQYTLMRSPGNSNVLKGNFR